MPPELLRIQPHDDEISRPKTELRGFNGPDIEYGKLKDVLLASPRSLKVHLRCPATLPTMSAEMTVRRTTGPGVRRAVA